MNTQLISTGLLSAVLFFQAHALERLEPEDGSYFGVTLTSGKTISPLANELGFTPAVYLEFFSFTGALAEFQGIRQFLEEVRSVQGIAMLTLEPWNGLESVTETNCRTLANLCAEFERGPIGGIFIRFAHEMNGNWYPWGQRPSLFRAKFRLLAGTLQASTFRTAMIWAPNYGVGYPFGTPVPSSDSLDFRILDTNRDGVISDRDDMYEPYYPGDDVVDWVGMTLYHWGLQFPWRENELPAQNSFVHAIRGKYQGNIPDFYARYCEDPVRRKPMAITETAAFFNTAIAGGPTELQIKSAWWRQVFNGLAEFPRIKCVNWFNELKRESIAQNDLIDWRISANEQVRTAFVRDLRASSNTGRTILTADDTKHLAPFHIDAQSLPDILPISGRISVVLNVQTALSCDLVIDLLDANFVWQGGTRVQVLPGKKRVATSFHLQQPLTDRTSYRWSIFLTPTGQDYTSAIVWYRGPHPSNDPDRDGATNEEEAIMRTSPRNAEDVLAIRLTPSPNNPQLMTVTWNSKPGVQYQLFTSSDLLNWRAASNILPGTDQTLSTQVPVNSAQAKTFFRVAVSP